MSFKKEINAEKKRVYKVAAIGLMAALVIVQILDWITQAILSA